MRVLLAKPRGFCAGVERAVRSVERAIACHGTPVHVLNHIVHNAVVVQELAAKGATFVRNLDDVPEGALVLFSAHGVGPEQWTHAARRRLHVIDATCPLVEKVHREARRFSEQGYTIVLIGQAGHDEVTGTLGWAPDHIQIVFTPGDVAAVKARDPRKVAYITQTTLSARDCEHVVAALRQRFPKIAAPPSDDICYATQNRQKAVEMLARRADLVLVVGDETSANSARLVQISREMGKPSYLISGAAAIENAWLRNVQTVLVTSGASAPEFLVRDVIAHLRGHGATDIDECEVVQENVHFALPEPIA